MVKAGMNTGLNYVGIEHHTNLVPSLFAGT
jgi:hypothetical protein